VVAVVLAVPGDQRAHLTEEEPDGVEDMGAVGGEQVPPAVGLERRLLPASLGVGEERWEQGRLDARAQVADAVPGGERPHLAEALGDEATGVLHPLVVPLHRLHLQRQPGPVHQLDQVLGLGHGRGEGLLDQHMPAGSERVGGEPMMEPIGGRDDHRLDRPVGQDRCLAGMGGGEAVAAGDGPGHLGARVADGHELDAFGLLQRREMGGLGDAPTADEGETDGIEHGSPPLGERSRTARVPRIGSGRSGFEPPASADVAGREAGG
jgi:hypothetical protein